MRKSPSVQSRDQGRASGARRDTSQRPPAATWETPYTWLEGWRTWSPGVAPPLLGLVLVFAATLPPEPRGTTSSVPVPVLFLLYFACGATYGLFLYFASSLNSWAKILLGGGIIYLIVALWLLWGLPFLILGTMIWAGLLVYYVQVCRHEVPEGTLHITTLFGRYWRSIPEGPALLLPGETVREETPNSVKQYETPLTRIHLRDIKDDRYVIEARATVSYRQDAVDALSRRTMLPNWESNLEKTIKDSLRDVLALSGHSALAQKSTEDIFSANGGTGSQQPKRAVRGQELAQALLERVRAQVRHHGLAIGWVRIRDLALAVDPRFSTASSELAPAAPAVLPPLGSGERNGRGAQAGADAGAGHTAAAEELSVEALLDLYNTVRVNDITDPETIRSIAEAFRTLARNQGEPSPTSTFDAAEVAELLFEYAASLE